MRLYGGSLEILLYLCNQYQQKPILYVGLWSERKNKQTEIRLKNKLLIQDENKLFVEDIPHRGVSACLIAG